MRCTMKGLRDTGELDKGTKKELIDYCSNKYFDRLLKNNNKEYGEYHIKRMGQSCDNEKTLTFINKMLSKRIFAKSMIQL